jgi:hypothetical protein
MMNEDEVDFVFPKRRSLISLVSQLPSTNLGKFVAWLGVGVVISLGEWIIVGW